MLNLIELGIQMIQGRHSDELNKLLFPEYLTL